MTKAPADGGGGLRRAQSPDTGFFEALGDLFFPDEDRPPTPKACRAAAISSPSTASQATVRDALDILDDEGAIDLDEREARWRAEGWGGYRGSDLRFGRGRPPRRSAGGATVPLRSDRNRSPGARPFR